MKVNKHAVKRLNKVLAEFEATHGGVCIVESINSSCSNGMCVGTCKWDCDATCYMHACHNNCDATCEGLSNGRY